MKRKHVVAAVTLAAALIAADPPVGEPVRLSTVRYDELTEAIRKQKGKVVVVDFWADYCLPCKREFPKLVALHRRFADAGLVAMSVSLDDAADLAARQRVKAFLEGRRASFANYLLDEKPTLWQSRLKAEGPPVVYVFNRKGELEERFADEIDYTKVESLVADLLKK
ncbi:MAG: TlpA disulfide reductase family protein [Gemmataceae bacterium]